MSTRRKILIALVLVGIGVTGRLLPHLWNFTPVIAAALFAGIYLGRSYAIFVPLVTMLLSDIFIGFYDTAVMLSVYGSIIAAGLIAFILRSFKQVETVVALSFVSSSLFFLVTNFAVWKFSFMYPPDLSGLLASYIAALPFYKNAILGDLFYTGVLFGVYEAATALERKIALKNCPQYTKRNAYKINS